MQGIFIGSREMFEQMNGFISEHELRPVIDRTFSIRRAARGALAPYGERVALWQDRGEVSMKIGIIGSGSVAQVLGTGFLSKGHEVMLGTRDASKLGAWLTEAGEACQRRHL